MTIDRIGKIAIDVLRGGKKNKQTNNASKGMPPELVLAMEELHLLDESWYLSVNRDVREAGLGAKEHFTQHGYREGRAPNRYYSPSRYPSENENPIKCFIEECIKAGMSTVVDAEINALNADERALYDLALQSGLFNPDWYLEQYADVYLRSNLHPWTHYTKYGWEEGRDPSRYFCTEKYLSTYKVRESVNADPLSHFLTHGRQNGLQYWPSNKGGAGGEVSKGALFIKNHNDPFTMAYRADAIAEQLTRVGRPHIKAVDARSLGKAQLVHFYDLVVLVRTAISPEIQSVINRARNHRIPIVFDVDDYVWDSSQCGKLRSLLFRDPKAVETLAAMMETWRTTMIEVDAISVSTWPLKKLASKFGKPVAVIPNSVPRQFRVLDKSFEKRARSNDGAEIVEIGYFSGTSTHQFDVNECLEALERLMASDSRVCLRLVGHVESLQDKLSRFGTRVKVLPLMPYREMLAEISRCDVVIAPLETGNIFCDCKSELKIFEAALFGIPVVCSPTATYATTIVDGFNGFLAGSSDEWLEKLTRLVNERPLREYVGKNAYASILPRFDTENVANTFLGFARNLADCLRSGRATYREIGSPSGKRRGRPVISLVTILHNKANELPDFFRGIQSQVFDADVEVILVDDMSTDHSVAISESWINYIRYSEFNDWIIPVLLKNEGNEGNCISRNRGIGIASAEIVVVVDADCVLSPNFFLQHLNAHQSRAGSVVIGYRGIETNAAPPGLLATQLEFDPDAVASKARNQDPYLLSDFVNCVTRNISFNKKNFPLEFDPLFSYTRSPTSGFGWEDVEFGYRLFAAGGVPVFLDDCFTLHVSHPFDGDDGDKAKRSAKNFRRLLEKHPAIMDLNPGWVVTTREAISDWLSRSGVDASELEDHRALENQLNCVEKKNIFIKKAGKKLKILSHKWHSPHQFELCKLGHSFDYSYVGSPGWDYTFRPIPSNARFVRREDVRACDYDLVIGHFDENILHPELCNGVVTNAWGQDFKSLLDFRDQIPMVAICHGTPQFIGQYDIFYDKSDLGVVNESSRLELVELLGATPVVLNSHQAQREWNFRKSQVIWHGFQPSEFYSSEKSRQWLAMSARKMMQRPVYNGFFLYKECMEAYGGRLAIEELHVSDSSLEVPRTVGVQHWARAKFAAYRQELARTSFYLNFTRRSPMPRIRGEAMMSGVVPITTKDHDSDLFVVHGESGFIFDSPDEFADIVRYVVSKPDEWGRWSANARSAAIKEFHIDRYLSEWRALLSDLAP